MRIRLSQPPAGDWLAGAWAELGNIADIEFAVGGWWWWTQVIFVSHPTFELSGG